MLEELRDQKCTTTRSLSSNVRQRQHAGSREFENAQTCDADDSYRSRRSHGQRWYSLGKELSLYNVIKDNCMVPLDSIVRTSELLNHLILNLSGQMTIFSKM
jgi:hypothetical protein